MGDNSTLMVLGSRSPDLHPASKLVVCLMPDINIPGNMHLVKIDFIGDDGTVGLQHLMTIPKDLYARLQQNETHQLIGNVLRMNVHILT